MPPKNEPEPPPEPPPEPEGEPEPPLHPLQPHLDDAGLKALVTGADAAADFAAVSEKLGMAPAARLSKALQAMTKTLTIRHWACVPESLCALLVTLASYKVATLRLWGCAFEPAELLLLKLGLPASVKTLALEGCDARAAGRFGPLFALAPSVSVLSLRCCAIGGDELAELAPALDENASLTALSLWGNPLGNEGAKALAAHLGGLRYLNVGSTRLGARGAQALGGALAENATLTSLDVSQNHAGTALGEAMLEALQANTALGALDLRANAIDDDVHWKLFDEKEREGSGRAKPIEIGLDEGRERPADPPAEEEPPVA